MKNKNIVIIGAGSDIGQAIAADLSLQNTLTLHYRQPTAGGVSADLSDPTAVDTLCEILRHQLETIDWIIYVAGTISTNETTALLSAAEIAKVFQINTLAPLHLITQLESNLSEDGGVILISSTAGVFGNGGYPVYAATKGALNTYAKSLAKRWHPHKYAFAICPGGTNTKMRQRVAGDAATQQSPAVIATLVSEIVHTPKKFPHAVYLARDSQITPLTE